MIIVIYWQVLYPLWWISGMINKLLLLLLLWYTSGGADCSAPDTSYLFSVPPFPTLPILWNVALLTCIFSRWCLQYASVLQAGIIFQAINWILFFYIPEQNGPLLVVSVIKHTFTTTQNTKLMHVRQLLIASCGNIARRCITTVLVF